MNRMWRGRNKSEQKNGDAFGGYCVEPEHGTSGIRKLIRIFRVKISTHSEEHKYN